MFFFFLNKLVTYLRRAFIYLLAPRSISGVGIIGLFIVLIYSLKVHASVVLNEVAIQPNQTVELYNTSSESIDISSWYIDDAGGTTYFTIPSQSIIAPKSCLLFNSDFNFNKASADIIRLFDNTGPPTTTSAKLIEQYPYSKAPDTGYSFSKKTDGGTEWQTIPSSLGLYNESLVSCVPSPTPTPIPTDTPIPTATGIPSPTVDSTQTPSPTSLVDYQNISISEVYPYPYSGEQEWIELYNGNSVQVNLDYWYIDDVENGGSTPKSFSLAIDPYSYGSITLSSSIFNNDGDTVRLLDANKNEKDSMEYGKITQGKSMGRISFSEDSYCEQEPSKNSPNSPCISAPTTQASSQTSSSQKTTVSTLKTISPAKKQGSQIQQQLNTGTNIAKTISPQPASEVLGAQTEEAPHTSSVPYLSSVSFSYSLLTIVSVFIKMKNA